ncbi:MAG TPA: alkaline phosphatase [Gemmatimonadales bacterium]
MRTTLLILLAMRLTVPGHVAAQDRAAPVRVILFVADGAGAGHWGIASWALERPAVMQFPVAGLVDTQGADHVVTGSAAAATALAIGVRTSRGALGVDRNGQPHETAFEAARAHGRATGLITTTSIVDATPAAFITHSRTRRDWPMIFADYARFQPEVMLGGGRAILSGSFGRGRADGSAIRNGYTYVTTADALRALDLSHTDRLLGLFTDGDLPLAPERDPSLAGLTDAALHVLGRDPDGFLLLVEQEETDTQAHRNAGIDTLTREMLALDDAIQTALRYREDHPETLIVVTADHETGGLSVRGDYTGEPGDIALYYHTTGHTAEPVPIFAIGPGAQMFGGFIRNDDVGRHLLAIVRGEVRPTGHER